MTPSDITPDEATMTRLLATSRARARRTDATTETEFAGKILCLVFDPVKANHQEHARRAQIFRSSFSGIASSRDQQQMFVECLTPNILGVSTLQDALEQPFDDLLRTPLNMEGGT